MQERLTVHDARVEAWQWHVSRLRARLNENPEDLESATELWRAISGGMGICAGSGLGVLECFRRAALASDDGASALASACRELWLASGEPPRRKYFDEELLARLKVVARNGAAEQDDLAAVQE